MASSIQQAPGVPALLDNIQPALPTLLFGDAVSLGDVNQQWGVYLNGVQVITFQSFLGIDFRQGWAISDYPVENGAFESYDKVDLPFDARVRFASGGSLEERSGLLESITTVGETLEFYDVVTPEVVYLNCNVQHYDYKRTNNNGAGMIVVELWLLEIRIVPQRGADVLFPSGASPINDGFVQAATAAGILNGVLGLIA